ncbi:MAG: glycerol-3-phosphate acyltransferase [Verrucomicrobia bacterium]|nr:glycerol-3-phosphate acyltransferase [Verrucomicrobiota bacterium]
MPLTADLSADAIRWGRAAALIGGSYLIGCLTPGYYLVRWRTGRDVRELGSGSVGAKNVGRVLGPAGFAVTLLLDMAKGALAVLAAGKFGASSDAVLLCALAVVAGHVWPCQLRFRGGKGIATAAGAVAFVDIRLVFAALAVCVVSFPPVRRVSLCGLIGFASMPVAAWWLRAETFQVLGLTALVALVLFAHRENLAEALDRKTVPPPRQD